MNISIIFPDYNLAYSPTTIGLYTELKSNFLVEVYCISPSQKNVKIINDINIHYINRLSFFSKFYLFLKYSILSMFSNLENIDFYRFKRQENIYAVTKKIDKSHLIIAIDTDTYWFYRSKGFNKIIFLSLEIKEKDTLIEFVRRIPPLACIIQSKIRHNYYFPKNESKFLELPNSMIYKSVPKLDMKSRETIIFNGTALKEFGLISIIEFIKKYSDYSLHILGSINEESKKILSRNLRVSYNSNYLENHDMIEEISRYKYGICFYERKYKHINTFNYETAPSGKLFAYLSAGVPVICTNQIGLKFIVDNKCGIQIENSSPENILDAINHIDSNYDLFSENCKELAKKLSFDNYSDKIIEFIKNL